MKREVAVFKQLYNQTHIVAPRRATRKQKEKGLTSRDFLDLQTDDSVRIQGARIDRFGPSNYMFTVSCGWVYHASEYSICL